MLLYTIQVTFSADGRKLLAVDVDGNRYKLDALPQDPDLLTILTEHKVCPCHDLEEFCNFWAIIMEADGIHTLCRSMSQFFLLSKSRAPAI
jgi:hypothetical protein